MIFSAATLVVGACLAHQAVRMLIGRTGWFLSWLPSGGNHSLPYEYLVDNDDDRSGAGSLGWLRVGKMPVLDIAFYTVGASAVLIGVSARIAGLLPALMLPLMYLTWLSIEPRLPVRPNRSRQNSYQSGAGLSPVPALHSQGVSVRYA